MNREPLASTFLNKFYQTEESYAEVRETLGCLGGHLPECGAALTGSRNSLSRKLLPSFYKVALAPSTGTR
jgi:hypothetical protein